MIVYKNRRFAVRGYQYGGSGIVSTIGSLLTRYATKAMLATAAKVALKGSLKAASGAGKVVLSKFAWSVLIVQLNDSKSIQEYCLE